MPAHVIRTLGEHKGACPAIYCVQAGLLCKTGNRALFAVREFHWGEGFDSVSHKSLLLVASIHHLFNRIMGQLACPIIVTDVPLEYL